MVLVTGGTGLLGAHLLYELCQKYDGVKAIKRANSDIKRVLKTFGYYSNAAESLFNKIEWLAADVTDIFSLEDAFTDVTTVYHCAAVVSFSPDDVEQMFHINVDGTANVVDLCIEKNIELCYVSSTAALGRDKTNPEAVIDENTQWKRSPDNSNYAKSKFQSEKEVWRGIAGGLKAVIVNPPIILGPTNWNLGSAKMFEKVWSGLRFYTQGANAFVDVRDVAKIMILLTEQKQFGERFVASSENMSYKKLFEIIADALGKKRPSIKAGKVLSGLSWRLASVVAKITGSNPLITEETARSANNVSVYSNSKLIKKLKYQFIPIEQSIKDTSKIFLKEHI
jgi:nucleoside-diphosphate-sugar epimerase